MAASLAEAMDAEVIEAVSLVVVVVVFGASVVVVVVVFATGTGVAEAFVDDESVTTAASFELDAELDDGTTATPTRGVSGVTGTVALRKTKSTLIIPMCRGERALKAALVSVMYWFPDASAINAVTVSPVLGFVS